MWTNTILTREQIKNYRWKNEKIMRGQIKELHVVK